MYFLGKEYDLNENCSETKQNLLCSVQLFGLMSI